MSPLVRPLLALAAAALLASAHAEDDLRVRLLGSSGLQGKRAACSELIMGPTPDNDKYIKKNELPRFHVDPPKNSTKKFEITMPDSSKKGEILVGQRVLVCDFINPDNSIDVSEVKDRKNQYTPLVVTCKKGCAGGVEVIADQFVIKTLT